MCVDFSIIRDHVCGGICYWHFCKKFPMKFSWSNRCLLALLVEFDRDGRIISITLESDVDGMVQQTFAIICCVRVLDRYRVVLVIFIM